MRQIEHNGEESDPENQREKLELMKLQFSQKMAVLQGQKLNIDDELENVGHCRILCICAFLMIEIFIDLMQKKFGQTCHTCYLFSCLFLLQVSKYMIL